MPYIKPSPNREAIDPHVQPLSENINNVGDLNYAVTRLVLRYILAKGLNYEDVNAAMGVFVASMLEMYRRVGVTYESLKLFQNGDVLEYTELDGLIRQMQRALPSKHVADETQAHG
jgi:hypothetical protein